MDKAVAPIIYNRFPVVQQISALAPRNPKFDGAVILKGTIHRWSWILTPLAYQGSTTVIGTHISSYPLNLCPAL